MSVGSFVSVGLKDNCRAFLKVSPIKRDFFKENK
jgi:hypothetical protein